MHLVKGRYFCKLHLCLLLNYEVLEKDSDGNQAESESDTPPLTSGLLSAYKFAEFIRRELVIIVITIGRNLCRVYVSSLWVCLSRLKQDRSC